MFLAASLIASTVIPYFPTLVELRHWWAFNTPPIEYSGISSCAFLLALSLLGILNLFKSNQAAEKVGERVILTYGSQLEKLLYRSLIDQKRVMVTLKNGKVYIGRVTISFTPQEDKDFLLLPIKSGYREGDKQRLVLTTHYDNAYAEIVENEAEYINIISDFGVVIPIPEVLTASLYREDVHSKYFPHENLPDDTKQLNATDTTNERLTAQEQSKQSQKEPVPRK
ncbi:MAG: hypothetical protein ABR555_01010 [Pyrinomonadaceae bacterium]